MSESINEVISSALIRTLLDDMRNAGAENDCVILNTPLVRQKMAQWGLCVFARDGWFWNGYEVIADANMPADNLYVVNRSSLQVNEAQQ